MSLPIDVLSVVSFLLEERRAKVSGSYLGANCPIGGRDQQNPPSPEAGKRGEREPGARTERREMVGTCR